MLGFILFGTTIKEQDNIEFNRGEFDKYKKYYIPKDLINNKWVHATVGVNDLCDTITFQGEQYNVSDFNGVFDKFISTNSKDDTIIIQLDYGNSIYIGKAYCSFDILAKRIEKYKNKGTYFFSSINTSKETNNLKTDTLDLYVNKTMGYNGEVIGKSDLSNRLLVSKPELVILRADKKFEFKDLLEVFEKIRELSIKVVLETR